MKILFYSFVLSVLVLSCRQEKLTTEVKGPIFKNDVNSTSPPHIAFVTDNSNSPTAKMNMLQEMMENHLPMNSPQKDYPTWKSYNEMYQAKVVNLSELTQQYCSQLFLVSYINSQQQGSPELNSVVKKYLSYLVSQNYKGYQLLYNTMEWLKNNNESSFVQVEKQKIEAYATPSLQAQNPKLQNSKSITESPQLKKEMNTYITGMKVNDTYIQKIKDL